MYPFSMSIVAVVAAHNMRPFLGLNFIIALPGACPARP
jgi:microcystin-dependent protein